MNEVEAVVDRASSELAAWLNARIDKDEKANPIVEPLFHYTDAAGLSGIFDSEQLWLTSVFHQNDPSEMRHGYSLAFSELKVATEQPQDRVGNAIRTLCAATESVLSNPISVEFYVASFSQDGDELGQWRGYGDDGRGFAIGFAPELFTHRQENIEDWDSVHVQRIVYDESEARAQIKPVISIAIDVLRRSMTAGKIVSGGDEPTLIEAVGVAMGAGIILAALSTKHKAYRAECETRLIMSSTKDRAAHIFTRARGPRLVPFKKLNMAVRKPGNITKIVVGPSAGMEAEHAARSILARYGLSDSVAVERSGIPYKSTR